MFLFLCSFSIAFWGCLVLFYFYLRFIKNFQIIRDEFPFFSQFFTIHLTCGVVDIVRNPGGRHTQARVPYAVALFTFLSLCPRLLPWARSVRACYSFTLSPRLLPRDRSVRADYLCMLCPVSAGLAWICSPFARVFSGLAQHHIECHHEAEAHHKCYGGAV